MYVCMHAWYVCMYVCVYVCMYVCMYVYVCMNINRYICISIYITYTVAILQAHMLKAILAQRKRLLKDWHGCYKKK